MASTQQKIVWVGFHEEGRFCIDALYNAGFEVAALFTLTDSESAKRSGVYDYATVADKYNIPLHRIRHVNDTSTVEALQRLAPDVIFVIGWSQILSEEVLDIAEWVVGAHASRLPENRGSAPINWSIIKGQTKTGNTLIKLVSDVDAGDMLAQKEFAIDYYDSCKTLYDKVALSNAEMIVEFCSQLKSDNVNKRKQTVTNEPILPRRRPEHGELDWSQSAEDVYNFIRALTKPYPGAFFEFHGHHCTVWTCSWDPEATTTKLPGSVCALAYSFEPRNCSVGIACRAGVVTLHEVEVDGVLLFGEGLINFFEKGHITSE